MQTTWQTIKDFAVSRSVSIQWVDLGSCYSLKVFDGPSALEFNLFKDDGVEQLDFETNFKALGNKSPVQSMVLTDGIGNVANQFDVDNALIVRTKAAKKGWTYCATGFTFSLATPASVSALNVDGTSKSWITVTCKDASGVIVTDSSLSSTIVQTYVDFEPPYDYEVIGGELRQSLTLIDDVIFFILAAPDIPAAAGGSKVMAEGLNIKFLAPGNMFSVDGRVSKLLTHNSVYHTSKLRFVFWHRAGLQEQIMITVEHYRQ
jgi:hypothetical protein